MASNEESHLEVSSTVINQADPTDRVYVPRVTGNRLPRFDHRHPIILLDRIRMRLTTPLTHVLLLMSSARGVVPILPIPILIIPD